jgi:hypothetical protein
MYAIYVCTQVLAPEMGTLEGLEINKTGLVARSTFILQVLAHLELFEQLRDCKPIERF